ncbi:type 2 periplasmic-binding domain-containing protein [Bifidobacterium eulemuris]|uniref:ABC transporter n=1 Tax=Bifidobacterium eulemuris TaxID=1765219 RepID=A0A261G9N1_9BIFI|nr:extracellular solute-binding protein [Bifidobacterium eulemuris]OZG68132.1 ABC transporter [Bifidobacterium eulemuris]QOL31805.1 extracellular solute-binding protein [Bifidobacterium eulemuris]
MARRGVAKRAAAALAAVGAMSMVLAGCGADDTAVDENGKPVVSILVQTSQQQDMSTMTDLTEFLEAECDCSIEWNQVDDTQWAQQKSATLSSGSVDDLSIRAYHPADAQKYQYFADFKEELDKLPNVEAFLEEQPDAEGMVTTPDGKMYTLPRYFGQEYKASGQHLFINKTWLDKLGLQVPTTWDELFDVMEAFKTQDPNGNGQADEIPYAMRNLDMTGMGWWSPFLFLNSTGITTQFNNSPSRYGQYVKDGKIGNYMVEDEYREVIEFLHTIIEKGYSPKDSLTQESSKYYASLQGDNGVATVGLAITNTTDAFGTGDSAVAAQYEAIPWPASSEGVTAVADYSQDAGAFEDYGVAMSAEVKNKDAALKIIDAMYSEEGSILAKYGNSDWITKDGDHTYTINPDYFTQDANAKTPYLADRFAGWISDEVTLNGDTGAEKLKNTDAVYADQLAAVGDNYLPITIVPSDEDSTTISNNVANIMSAALTQSASWIQDGGLDDASWNAFVENLKGLGVDENNELYQKWYDEALKK